jgi:lipopolysaccharide export system protein LptA
MKLNKIIIIFLFVINLYGNSTDLLTIKAINFSVNETKNLILFSGDVKMDRINDKLYANELVVKTQKDVETNDTYPILYTAIGDVKLEIVTTKKHYLATGDKVIYKPLENKYIILGNGFAEDKNDNRKLYGDKIFIDTLTGEAKIDGSKKKPIRFIMQLKTQEVKE